jgi:hypothetical protein
MSLLQLKNLESEILNYVDGAIAGISANGLETVLDKTPGGQTYIALDTSGNQLSYNAAGLKSAVSDINSNVTSLTAQVGAKQNSLTAIGDISDAPNIRLLNGVNVRAIKAGSNMGAITVESGLGLGFGGGSSEPDVITINGQSIVAGTNMGEITSLNGVVTINGQSLSNYVDISSVQTITGNKTFTGTVRAPTINATTALQVAGVNINTIYAQLTGATFTGTVQAPTINATTALQVAGTNINTLYAQLTGATFTGTVQAPTINATTALQVAGTNINTIYAPLSSPTFNSQVTTRFTGHGLRLLPQTNDGQASISIHRTTDTALDAAAGDIWSLGRAIHLQGNSCVFFQPQMDSKIVLCSTKIQIRLETIGESDIMSRTSVRVTLPLPIILRGSWK